MVTGVLSGLTTVVVNEQKPPGWVYRINLAAAWLALISVSILLTLYGSRGGWAHMNLSPN
jgi:hypothetical protein